MKKKQIGATILCSLFFMLLSCSEKTDAIADSLQRAEKYMEAHPDSALIILQEILNPEELQGKNQADYGMLMTQALDKNYLPLKTDSLIQLAINYYKDSNNEVAKGKAYFYYGRYLYEAKKHKEALDVFLKSKQILEGSKQYKLLGLLSGYIGNINMEKHWHNEALSNHRESLKYYVQAKDTLSMTFALRNVGRVYLLKNELDSVFFYCTSALKIASDKNLKSESAILHELSVISRLTGDYDKAESYMLTSIDRTNSNDAYLRYLSLGILYFQAQKYGDAEVYLKKSLESSKLETLASAYSYLYRLSMRKEDYKKAVTYVEKRDSTRNQLIDLENQKNIFELQEKYRNEQLRYENLQIRDNRNILVLLGIIFILVILIIAIYYYYHNYNNKRRVKDIEYAIDLNQKEIDDYRVQLVKYSESETGYQNDVGELIGKISLLTNQNRDLTERLVVLGHEKMPQEEETDTDTNTYMVAFRTLLAIKNGTLNRKLSEHDFSILIKLFNFLYNDYIDRLNSEFPGLTRHEMELCCLLKMRFSNQELCYATNTALDSVRKAKSRLKMSLRILGNESLEDFLASY